MRPTEPPGPAGAVSISCVGSPPGTARLLEVGELGKDWVVGGQAAPSPRARTLRLIVSWVCGIQIPRLWAGFGGYTSGVGGSPSLRNS